MTQSGRRPDPPGRCRGAADLRDGRAPRVRPGTVPRRAEGAEASARVAAAGVDRGGPEMRMPTARVPFDRRRGLLAATEPARALASFGSLAAALPLLSFAPRGDRHPVLVLPGLGASDLSTGTLRSWLGGLGYPVVGWALGRNRGPTQEVLDELPRLLARLHGEHGSPVSIVGQSLGGIYARRLALRAPEQVRQVITLGSPFAFPVGAADASPGARAYDRYRHLDSTG